jgi:hypothetical protein
MCLSLLKQGRVCSAPALAQAAGDEYSKKEVEKIEVGVNELYSSSFSPRFSLDRQQNASCVTDRKLSSFLNFKDSLENEVHT